MAYEDVTGVFAKLVRDGITLEAIRRGLSLPRLPWCFSGCYDLKDRSESVGIRAQPGRVDDGADVGLAGCGPHRSIAVGDLALDNGGPQSALAGIVRRLDMAGVEGEGQELVAGSPELVLDGPGELAPCRRRENGGETFLQSLALGRDRRSGEPAKIVG